MKKISILIPCYNEEDNVCAISRELVEIFNDKLLKYSYEIIFIDNCSTDNTRVLLTQLCDTNKNIKSIFNARNFGFFNSQYYGLLQTTGDCAILLSCDFQDPLCMIERFVEEWENGYKIVVGTKKRSKTNPLVHFLRGVYYKIIKKYSYAEQIEHFTGFGLYDASFISVLKELKDPMPYLRGMVGELGFDKKEIPYIQAKREKGKSKFNLSKLYDASMLGLTSYTKFGMRFAMILGSIVAVLSFLVGVVYLVLKILYWDTFLGGTIPTLLAVLFLGGTQLIFLSLIGEYIMAINKRVLNRPLVIEEKRINFNEEIDRTKEEDGASA